MKAEDILVGTKEELINHFSGFIAMNEVEELYASVVDSHKNPETFRKIVADKNMPLNENVRIRTQNRSIGFYF